MTHAHTVCTRPFFFLPRAKRARLPTREKEGLGTRLCLTYTENNESGGSVDVLGLRVHAFFYLVMCAFISIHHKADHAFAYSTVTLTSSYSCLH